MERRVKVIKADGSVEDYFHTKVMGTISNALGCAGLSDVELAEELAEVVTYYVYHRQGRNNVTSGEIHSIITGVLEATNYEAAAIALSEYHFERKLKRSRVEVVRVDISEQPGYEKPEEKSRWDKSRIVEDLMCEYNLAWQIARAIASMVEEKVLVMGLGEVPTSLIKQIVLSDMTSILRAERELQTVSSGN